MTMRAISARPYDKDEVSLWADLQKATQDGVKGELLKSLQEDTSKNIARKVRPGRYRPPRHRQPFDPFTNLSTALNLMASHHAASNMCWALHQGVRYRVRARCRHLR